MRLSEITEDFDIDAHKYKPTLGVGQEMFSFNPQNGSIVPVTIKQRNFMGKEYKVVYAGDPPHSGNGGIWAANADELFNTKEEAAKAMFKDKLTGKR